MDRVLSQFDDVAEVPTATPSAAAWTAREKGSERRVLIKKLPDTSAKTRATQSLALNHPNVVNTRRWLRDQNALYVVRDFVPGRNLRTAYSTTTQHAFSELRATLDPVLDALDYAHLAGLPHGGVTPENVLVGEGGKVLLSDFATALPRNGDRKRYAPAALLGRDGEATNRLDYFGLCELYKEFLPERSDDDEAGAAARVRLLRNLTEIQQTCISVDELRYKLDAVTKMAELLGFTGEAGGNGQTKGARLVCFVTPPSVTLNSGGGTSVVLTVYNEGDAPLRIEAVGSDVVWLNYHARFTPFTLPPDTERDLVFTLSGARLAAGSFRANLLVRSNSGMQGLSPPPGLPWHEQVVALPVLSRGSVDTAPPPLIERLPDVNPAPPQAPKPDLSADLPILMDQPAISCTQDPDPGLVRHGEPSVLHLNVRNISKMRLRIDRIKTPQPWLVYPGEFKPIWIEPGGTHSLGFSVLAPSLIGGDYRGEVIFKTSGDQTIEMGVQTVWSDLMCDLRVRVVPPLDPNALNAARNGCATTLLLVASSFGVLSLLAAIYH